MRQQPRHIILPRWAMRDHVKTTARQVMATFIQKQWASSKVFAVPELLEQILMDLEIRELLVNTQRVDKTWRATIKASKKLQQALFFEPVPFSAIHSSRLQPMKECPPLTLPIAHLEAYSTVDGMPEFVLDSSIVRNPLIERVGEGFRRDRGPRPRFCADAAVLRPTASWRSMFTTQPPVQIIRRGASVVKLGDASIAGWLPTIHSIVSNLIWCTNVNYAKQVRCILSSESEEDFDQLKRSKHGVHMQRVARFA